MTIGPGIVIDGSGGSTIGYDGGGPQTPIINQGTIDSDQGGSIDIYATTLISTGTLAGYGSVLNIDAAYTTQAGTLEATDSGDLSIGGIWTDTGPIINDDSFITLGGSLTLGPGAEISGYGQGAEYGLGPGTVFLDATLDPLGTTLDVNGSGLNLALEGGTIAGGTVNLTGGATMVATTAGETLEGVTLDGTLDMTEAAGVAVTVTGGLTLDGTVLLGNFYGGSGESLNFVGAQTLGGTGTITFGASAAITTAASGGDSGTLTIGPGIVIDGTGSSTIGYDGGGPQTPLIIQGTVDATEGGALSIYGTDWTNAGTLEAEAGSTLDLATTPSNLASGTLTGGTWEVGADSTLTIAGANITTNAATIIVDGPNTNFPALAPLATNAASGLLELFNGASLTTAGSLDNAGTITIDPSALYVSGNYTQQSTGALDIGIGGYFPGSPTGLLNVTGTATLTGALNVSLTGGFVPTPGESFTVLTFASRSGNFTTETGLDIGGGQSLVPYYSPGSLDLFAFSLSGFVVTNLNHSGPGSLRSAITNVNIDPIPTDFDQVTFATGIQGGTISLLSPLPALTRSDSGIIGPITLDGSSAGTADGLDLSGDQQEVEDLTIIAFSGAGISVSGYDDSVLGSA